MAFTGRGTGAAERLEEAVAVELVERFQRGEAQVLSELHARLGPAMGALLRTYRSSRLPSAITVQDLQQQSWIILSELAGRWKPRGSFLAYFFRSFPHMVGRYVQVHRRSAGIAHEDAIRVAEARGPYGAAPEPPFAEPEALGGLGLERLSGVEQAVFAMRAVDHEPFEVIGTRLGVTRASANRIYRRAHARLTGATLAGVQDPADAAGGEVFDSRLRGEAGPATGSAGTSPAATGSAQRAQPRPGGDVLARVVQALHGSEGARVEIVGRRRVLSRVSGISRVEYEEALLTLQRCGAVVGRDARHAGRLTAGTPEETLALARGARARVTLDA